MDETPLDRTTVPNVKPALSDQSGSSASNKLSDNRATALFPPLSAGQPRATNQDNRSKGRTKQTADPVPSPVQDLSNLTNSITNIISEMPRTNRTYSWREREQAPYDRPPFDGRLARGSRSGAQGDDWLGYSGSGVASSNGGGTLDEPRRYATRQHTFLPNRPNAGGSHAGPSRPSGYGKGGGDQPLIPYPLQPARFNILGSGNNRGRGYAGFARTNTPHRARHYPGSETEEIIMPPRPKSPEIAWGVNTVPYTSAYQWTIAHPDPRTTIPAHLLQTNPIIDEAPLVQLSPSDPTPEERKETFGKDMLSSWAHSTPTPKARRAVKRVLRDLNTSLARHFRGYQFVIEPFGSVSWGAETSESGDLDLVLRDFARPRGYTPDLWSSAPIEDRGLPAFYKTSALARALRTENYLDVEPIKWAAIPIVKFKDNRSGVAIDLQTNDLGGWMNSQLLLAYARTSPYLLRPLIHIVKSWAKARRINDPSGAKGGRQSLSSYCWCLMCISYLQIAGKIPNLQAEDLVRKSGRTGCDVFTNWARPVGQRAEVAFAAGEALEALVPDGAPAGAAKELADAVQGFFELYRSSLAPKQGTNARASHLHAFSVWRGGKLERYEYKDPKTVSAQSNGTDIAMEHEDLDDNVASGGDEVPVIDPLKEPMSEVTAAQSSGGAVQQAPIRKIGRMEKIAIAAARPPEYFPEKDGFCQPKKWAIHDLVVQDPLIHDKNCAGHIDKVMAKQLHQEFTRACEIISTSGSLAELLEEAPQPKSKKEMADERRLAMRELERAAAAAGAAAPTPAPAPNTKKPNRHRPRHQAHGKSES